VTSDDRQLLYADVTLVSSTSSAAASATVLDMTTTAVASPSTSAAAATTSTAAATTFTTKGKRRKQPAAVLVDVAAAVPLPSSTVASGKRKLQRVDVADVAAQENPSKTEREQLFAECQLQFGATGVVTRSQLQQWQPNISDGNINYLLMRRNVVSANKMVLSMQESSKQRQQSILDSFAKK